MTIGSGLYINPTEQKQETQNRVIAQLIEGRSNAVGSCTLTHDGATTTTVVTALTCGINSAVFLFPQTANAAAALATMYIDPSNVIERQFTITHAATSNADETFFFLCIG